MGAFFCTDVMPSADKLSRCLLPQRARSTVLQERLLAGRPAGARPRGKTLLENSTASWSALGMTSAQKDAPISPSLRCLCAMRKLLPLVSCHEAARRPAGPNTRIADGATREPGACCKSCYPRSTSTTRHAASCCKDYVLKFNRRGATSR